MIDSAVALKRELAREVTMAAICGGVLVMLLAFPLQGTAFAKSGRPEDSPGHKSGHHGADDHSSGGSKGSVGSQSGGGNGKFEARLRSASDPSGPSHGSLKVERSVKRGVVREARVTVKAEVAPASIADSTSELRVEIARGGALYATCLAVFDEVDDDHAVPLAEYKVDVKVKKAAAKSKAGYCDLDPSTAAIDNGVPEVAIGDVVTVLNPLTNEVVLTGAVAKKGKK